MTYEIRSDVPMPKERAHSKWPFKKMEIGQCLIVDSHEARQAASAAYRTAEYSGYAINFSVRKIKDQPGKTGIWRVS